MLIVGAGLSGIGAACRLEAEAAGHQSYAILEARGASGGTWDLFRFPGVRSDSDMFTLGYPFRPWTRPRPSPRATTSCSTCARPRPSTASTSRSAITAGCVEADWSSADARWTVTVEDTSTGEHDGADLRFPVRVLGLLPLRRGLHAGLAGRWTASRGTVVHPQFWPDDLDLTGKKVVLIGSGATAATILPAIAGHRGQGDDAAAVAVVRAVDAEQ